MAGVCMLIAQTFVENIESEFDDSDLKKIATFGAKVSSSPIWQTEHALTLKYHVLAAF